MQKRKTRTKNLTGYAAKRQQGRVPHVYDRQRMRGVYPPVSENEAYHYSRASKHSYYVGAHQWRM